MNAFEKWNSNEIEIKDPGLGKYINLNPKLVPHTSGKHSKKRFQKAEVWIVERLINKIMRSEENSGKKHLAYNVVKEAFEIIHKRTKKNPVQVLVDAIINAGPREETTKLKYGGIVYQQAVDVSPQRRVDIALRLIAMGAKKASFGNKKSFAECLASEIIGASEYDTRFFSIQKKDEIERIAKSSR
ncbi:MAG: 30S ribosomal protein S7 [Candidatus Hydrothermarchaeota archaeon]